VKWERAASTDPSLKMADKGENKKVPSEFVISDKWDKATEDILIKTSTGILVGSLAAVVLFRKLNT
jgi:hypothetical protein